MEQKQNLYKFYSTTLIDPMSFEDFKANFHQKWKQAYQVGIVEPKRQLALIDVHHKPTKGYDFGFRNGMKLAMAIMDGVSIELEMPEIGIDDKLSEAYEVLKKTAANLKGQITKLKKTNKLLDNTNKRLKTKNWPN